MQPSAAILSVYFPKEDAAKVRACARRAGKTTSRYLYEVVMGALVYVGDENKPQRNLRVIRGGKR
jgi:hypothetical protein